MAFRDDADATSGTGPNDIRRILEGRTKMFSIYVRFTLHPSKKPIFLPSLTTLMETMSQEPSFVSAVLSEDPDVPDELILFEVWDGSKEAWLLEQPQKAYRMAYGDATKDLVASKEVRFLSPLVANGLS